MMYRLACTDSVGFLQSEAFDAFIAPSLVFSCTSSRYIHAHLTAVHAVCISINLTMQRNQGCRIGF